MEDRQEIDFRRILTEIEAVDDPVRIFEWVRDIPYGVIDSRDPADVYARHRGTCSGKHLLLAQLLEHMGMEVRHVIAFHRYSELPMETEYPKNLRELLGAGDGIPDYHNYLEARAGGLWLLIDATFDSPLRDFFIVNDWDGESGTELSVRPIETRRTTDPVSDKEALLVGLSAEVRRTRRRFLREFSDWLESLRGERTPI